MAVEGFLLDARIEECTGRKNKNGMEMETKIKAFIRNCCLISQELITQLT